MTRKMTIVAAALLALAAASSAKEVDCGDAIARAIEKSFNIARVPMGMVNVPAEQAGRIGELAELRARGAVTYVEIPKKAGDESGERTFVVTPTKLALRFRDDAASTADAIGIPIRTCEIVTITSGEPAGGGEASVEEQKLVTGVYRLHPTPAGEELFRCSESDDLRFRALVAVNPGTGSCTVKAVDWGRPGRSDWETSSVE